MKRRFETYKDWLLVQSIQNGEAIDHAMFKPNERDKARQLVRELAEDGIKARIVPPSEESIE